MMNPEVENKIAQSMSYNSAMGRKIREKASRILANRGFDDMPETAQAVMQELIQAFLYNKGDNFGWEDPGANYMVLSNALASAFPDNLFVRDEMGNSIGSTVGHGTINQSIARQLTGWIEDRSYNEYGERTLARSNGLSTSLQAGIIGQYMMQRGLKSEDFVQTTFGDGTKNPDGSYRPVTSAQMADQINALKDKGVDVNSQEMQQAMRTQYLLKKQEEFFAQDNEINKSYNTQRSDYEKKQTALEESQKKLEEAKKTGNQEQIDKATKEVQQRTSEATESATKLLAVEEERQRQAEVELVGKRFEGQGDMKGFKATKEDMEAVQKARNGSYGGAFMLKGITDELQEVLDMSAGTVKELAETFGTNNFAELQKAVKEFGLGSLTSKRDVDEIHKRMIDAKAEAIRSNRSMAEVMQEQADIAHSLSAVYGNFTAPTEIITQIQRTRYSAERDFNNGTSYLTPEEKEARELANKQSDKNLYGGYAVVKHLLKKAGREDDPEFLKLEKMMREAKTTEEIQEVAAKIKQYGADQFGWRTVNDPHIIDKAWSEYSADISLNYGIEKHAQEDARRAGKNGLIWKPTVEKAKERYSPEQLAELEKNKQLEAEIQESLLHPNAEEDAKIYKDAEGNPLTGVALTRAKEQRLRDLPTTVEDLIAKEYEDAQEIIGGQHNNKLQDILKAHREGGKESSDKVIDEMITEMRNNGQISSDEEEKTVRTKLQQIATWDTTMEENYYRVSDISRNMGSSEGKYGRADKARQQTKALLDSLRKDGQGTDYGFTGNIAAGLMTGSLEFDDQNNIKRYIERNNLVDENGKFDMTRVNTELGGKIGKTGHMAAMKINKDTGEIENAEELAKNENFISILKKYMPDKSEEEIKEMITDPGRKNEIYAALTTAGAIHAVDGENGIAMVVDNDAKREMLDASQKELDSGKKLNLDTLGSHLDDGSITYDKDGNVLSAVIDGAKVEGTDNIKKEVERVAMSDKTVRDRIVAKDEDKELIERITKQDRIEEMQKMRDVIQDKNSNEHKALVAETYNEDAARVYASEAEWKKAKLLYGNLAEKGSSWGIINSGEGTRGSSEGYEQRATRALRLGRTGNKAFSKEANLTLLDIARTLGGNGTFMKDDTLYKLNEDGTMSKKGKDGKWEAVKSGSREEIEAREHLFDTDKIKQYGAAKTDAIFMARMKAAQAENLEGDKELQKQANLKIQDGQVIGYKMTSSGKMEEEFRMSLDEFKSAGYDPETLSNRTFGDHGAGVAKAANDGATVEKFKEALQPLLKLCSEDAMPVKMITNPK